MAGPASKGKQANRARSKSTNQRIVRKGRRVSDALFAEIIEKMNEGFVALDAQMNYTYVNQRGGELLARKPEELVGKNYWEEYPQDKETPFGRAYQRALETQTPIVLEDYYTPGDRWFENRIYPSEDGLSIFFNDVTERRQTEQAGRESEGRFHTLANGSPVLLWVNGLEGCEFVNRAYLDFLGVDNGADVLGYDWSGFVHPGDRESYLDSYQRAFAEQAPFYDEFRFRRYDGAYRWMRSEALPRRAEDGTFLGYVGASVDITERKQVEQALQLKDQQLHRVTDVTPTLISHCSRDLRYLFVNRTAAEFLGFPADEIVGRPIREIMGDEAFDAILPYVERVLKGERVEYEMELPYPAAGRRFMHIIYVPEVIASGQIVGWVATVTDMTERKALEDELQQSLINEAGHRARAEEARVEAEQARAEAEEARAVAERELAERELAEAALGEWVDAPLPREARPASVRYGVALAAAVFVVLAQAVLTPVLGESIQFSALLIAVAFSVWYGGIGPATLSLIVGYVGVVGFILDWRPVLELTPALATSHIIFLMSNLAIMALGRAMDRAQRHAHHSARVAVERQRQMEVRLVEQLRVEAALRESERKFSLIYHRLPFAAALSSPIDGVIMDVNREFENAFGYSRQEAIGRTSLELGINPDAAKRASMLAELKAQGSAHNVELALATRMHGERVFLINLDLVDLEGQKFILQTAQDITERKRTEQTLRDSEARLRLATEAAQMFTWELDIQRQASRVADSFAEAVGFSADLIPGDNAEIMQRFIHPEDGEVILQALTDAVQNQHDLRAVQYRIVHPETGAPIWLEVNGKIAYDSAGAPTQMFGVAQNINERKRVEDELRRAGERERVRAAQLEAIMEAVPAVIWIAHDAESNVVTGNRASYEILRMQGGENASLSVPDVARAAKFDVLHNDRVLQPEELPVQRAARGDELFGYEEEIRFEDGSSVHLFGNAITLRDDESKPAGALAAFVDITARKRAEAELQQLNLELEGRVGRRTAQLQAANQALEESQARLQALSQRLVEVQEEERRAIARELHDRVGQSLSALNLNLAIINSQLSALVNEQVNARLSDSIHLVADVIAQVRDVMANLRPSVLDDFGLEAALQANLEEFQARYLVSTRFERASASLPRLGAGIEMTLLRIMQECLLNVARHAQASQVAVSLRMEADTVRLVVQDDGIGIQSWQLANRPGSHGLMIMRERAEAVKGSLQLSSTPGKGTQIDVSVPLKAKSLTAGSL